MFVRVTQKTFAMHYRTTDFSEKETILMIGDPAYCTLYKRNGRFLLFANDIPEMGYYNDDLHPIGEEGGYESAYYCDLAPYGDRSSGSGYLALGTRDKWEIYNMSFHFEPEIKASGAILFEAFRKLDEYLGVDMSQNFRNLSFGPTEMEDRVTPDMITRMEPHQIFVFGSNDAGHHGAGAARYAMDHFGAVWGQGTGLQGQSYAIPTMSYDIEVIRSHVNEFLGFASCHPEYQFLVTPIGCGIAGMTPEQIAPLFDSEHHRPDNVFLPKSFWDVIKSQWGKGV